MSTILYVGTSGTNDPTRATLPFLLASGAVDEGFQAGIALLGEAAYLMKDVIAGQIHGVGFPPLIDLLEKVKESQVPIYV